MEYKPSQVWILSSLLPITRFLPISVVWKKCFWPLLQKMKQRIRNKRKVLVQLFIYNIYDQLKILRLQFVSSSLLLVRQLRIVSRNIFEWSKKSRKAYWLKDTIIVLLVRFCNRKFLHLFGRCLFLLFCLLLLFLLFLLAFLLQVSPVWVRIVFIFLLVYTQKLKQTLGELMKYHHRSFRCSWVKYLHCLHHVAFVPSLRLSYQQSFQFWLLSCSESLLLMVAAMK